MRYTIRLKDKSNNELYPIPRYRIGDIIISTNSQNPSVIYGGTWELYGPGRAIVCIDTSQTEFNTIGKTGGSKSSKLNQNNLPNTLGTIRIYDPNAQTQSSYIDALNMGWSNKWRDSIDNLYNPMSQQEFTNLQPFITAYIWRKTDN